MKVAVFYIKYQGRVSCNVQCADVTLGAICRLVQQCQMEKKILEDIEIPKTDPKDWSKMIESVVEYLGTFWGITGMPL